MDKENYITELAKAQELLETSMAGLRKNIPSGELRNHEFRINDLCAAIARGHTSLLDALQKIAKARNSGSTDARYLGEIACDVLTKNGYKTPKLVKRLKEANPINT